VGFKSYLNDQLVSFSALTLLVWSYVKIVPDMTCNVFGGTLNLAQSIKPRNGVGSGLPAQIENKTILPLNVMDVEVCTYEISCCVS